MSVTPENPNYIVKLNQWTRKFIVIAHTNQIYYTLSILNSKGQADTELPSQTPI